MKKFFRDPSKVALPSFIATICVFILLMSVLQLARFDSVIIHLIGKVAVAIFLVFLLLNPLLGFIYSFFAKGKIKILYIILHLACICTISVFALTVIMFRYFVPFAP